MEHQFRRWSPRWQGCRPRRLAKYWERWWLSEVVAKTNAETLACVEVKAPRLTEAHTVAALEKTQLSTH